MTSSYLDDVAYLLCCGAISQDPDAVGRGAANVLPRRAPK